jgi:hypothetical protein
MEEEQKETLMDEEFHKAVEEYAAVLKEDATRAEAVLEKYREKFGEDFEKWAAAIREVIKMVMIRKENPHLTLEEVRERAMDS